VEIVRRWLAEVAGELGAAPGLGAGTGVPAAEALRLRVMPAWEPDVLAAVTSSPVPLAFDALVVLNRPGFDAASLLAKDVVHAQQVPR
jgi:hypothetical protein